MEHTPEELAHLIGDCTPEEAQVMLAAPALLEALENMLVNPNYYRAKARAAIKATKGDA